MIPAQQPYEARFRYVEGNRTTFSSVPVIAWDDLGHALIADEKTGRLVRANQSKNFAGLLEGQSPVVAAIPGGGWHATYREEDGSTTSDPVVAWTIRADGSVTPIDTDSAGETDSAINTSNFVGLEKPAADDA